MPVNGVAGTGANSVSSAVNKAMGGIQDQFMKILLTELRYQDPMDPMKDRDFFAQMAQFTIATQMEELNQSMAQMTALLYQGQVDQSLLSAASLIGRQFQSVVDGMPILGVVEAVSLKNGQVMVRSGEHEIPAYCLTLIGGFQNADQDL